MSVDFTLSAYRQLLSALQQSDYAFHTFEEWCQGKVAGRYVLLRHDVDLKAGRSLVTATIEAEMGIRATYYFRIVPQSNQPEIIRAIAALGHEIGYHYEDVSLFNGDMDKAFDHFKTQLAYFRQFYPVKTICMHGSPTSKFDNRDLWKLNDYRELGVLGEPYLDFLSSPAALNGDIVYFTDTARMWDGGKYNVRDKSVISHQSSVISPEKSESSDSRNVEILHHKLKNELSVISSKKKTIHSTYDFIEYINNKPIENGMMITTHPQRWTDKPLSWLHELIFQNIKNSIKKMLVVRQ
ncbi:MAG: hypothetical protein JZU53_11840 [Paludibacter sp.]|nr:hypothetical protein [Paludibacter sp.]